MHTSTDQTTVEDTTRPAAAATGKLPQSPSTILVADDEHLVASGIAGLLGELGYSVVGPAPDGEKAIQLCDSVRPDLALLDIRMPGIDGLSAAQSIFERFRIPVVMLSAYSDPDYVNDAAKLGVFGYLLKPVNQDQLRASITVAWKRFVESREQTAEIGNLKQRLEHRKVIEQAKWILVKRKGIEEPEAMRTLQRHARNNRRTLADVALSIIENEDLFAG